MSLRARGKQSQIKSEIVSPRRHGDASVMTPEAPLPRNDESLRHFINHHTALLKDRFQEAIEFFFVHTVAAALEITNIDITNMITIDNFLCSHPVIGRV